MVDAKTGERSKRYLWRCQDCKQQYCQPRKGAVKYGDKEGTTEESDEANSGSADRCKARSQGRYAEN